MRLLFAVFALVSASFFAACGGSDTTNSNTSSSTTGTDSTGAPTEMDANQERLRANHDCKIEGKVLDNNQFWIREQEVLVAIVADSSTADKNLGDSHRVVEAYDTKNCERIFRSVLPVNVSADFPYYLSEITYNNISQVVAIRGFNTIYAFNIADKKLSGSMKPNFKTMRFPVDAQTGMIKRLEVWENYLIGFAQDQGVFVFDLSNRSQPKAVLPFAEYKIEENDFASLFLLNSGSGGQQAIVPTYDAEKDQFSVNALLDQPSELSRGVMETAKNNRFLVLRQADAKAPAIGVDMMKRKRVQLPADKATAKTQEIVEWMKKQAN